MRWARWPPPDEEGERTRRQNKHNYQIDHRRGGGEMVVTAVTMTMMTTTMTTMKPRKDRGCSGGEWRAAAMTVAVAMRGCFGNIISY